MAMATKRKKMETHEIVSALSKRYPTEKGRWGFATEVPNGTGGNMSRSCDAIAVSLWPSDGLGIHGHEVKAERGDWLREMQDASKADAFAKYCNYWFIVAPVGVVKLEELPETWGWIAPTSTGNVRVKKMASKLSPDPIPRSLLCGLIRAFGRADRDKQATPYRQDRYRVGYLEGQARAEACLRYQIQNMQRRCEELERYVKNFAEFQCSWRESRELLDRLDRVLYRERDSLQLFREKVQAMKAELAATQRG
ncbi:MAG: hypothetical protein AAFP69_05120 [Planctomycetota bacterium]